MSSEKEKKSPEIAERMRSEGHKPYIIPYGGSNVVGALGFVAAIEELKVQLSEMNIQVDHLIFPSSSGGTHAGVTVGLNINDLSINIIGIGVDRRNSGETLFENELAELATKLTEKLGVKHPYLAGDFLVNNDYLGKGYGKIGDLEREAIMLMARHEGILLDPVYSGRAAGGMIDMIRKKRFRPDETILFWHTGGTPALFDYARELL